jgi:hypothetical protein
MNGRRAIIGLCMLCALVFSALAAQGASAAGTTAFTCKAVTPAAETKGFSKEHCKTADAVTTNAKFEHVAFAAGTATDLTVTNAKTNAETNGATSFSLHSVQSGVEEQLSATGVMGEGTITNSEAGGEMLASGTSSLTFTGVTVQKPVGKGCKVYEDINPTTMGPEGQVKTNSLKGTTFSEGEKMGLKFEPAVGEVFATFYVTECSVAALNGTYEVKGSIKTTTVDGATIEFTSAETTGQGTLKTRGQKSGIDGKLTLSGKDTPAGDLTDTPLSLTTT